MKRKTTIADLQRLLDDTIETVNLCTGPARKAVQATIKRIAAMEMAEGETRVLHSWGRGLGTTDARQLAHMDLSSIECDLQIEPIKLHKPSAAELKIIERNERAVQRRREKEQREQDERARRWSEETST